MVAGPKHPLIDKAQHRPLTQSEQDELARDLGLRVEELPLAWRGGLMGIWGRREPAR